MHPLVNLPDGDIEGLTPELARRLSLAECSEVLARYCCVLRAFAAMEGALAERIGGEDAPYMKEAINDLLEASECVLRRTPNYGQSNWASLQAAEKVFKSYILETGGSHGRIHKLQQLCDAAAALGLPLLDPRLIAAIQCKPDVRYDAHLVSRDQAFAAYRATRLPHGQARGAALGPKVYRFDRSGVGRDHGSGRSSPELSVCKNVTYVWKASFPDIANLLTSSAGGVY